MLKKLGVLQWKNFKLKQRKWATTLIELLAPLLPFLLLVGIRHSREFRQKSPACQFKPVALASKGPLAALQSFCHLGVCQRRNQTFHTEAGLFIEEEYRNVSRALEAANRWLANPSVEKLAAAFAVVPGSPANQSNHVKRIRLASLFSSRSSGLLQGVRATQHQRRAIGHATFRFPRLWHVSVSPLEKLMLLSPLLQVTDTVPNLVCNSGDGWPVISALCRQARFRANLKDQFDLDAALDQMTSTASNRHTLDLEASDVKNLKEVGKEIYALLSDGTFNVFAELRNLTASLISGGISVYEPRKTLELVSRLGRIFCGNGTTVFSQILAKMRRELNSLELLLPLAAPPPQTPPPPPPPPQPPPPPPQLKRKARSVTPTRAKAQANGTGKPGQPGWQDAMLQRLMHQGAAWNRTLGVLIQGLSGSGKGGPMFARASSRGDEVSLEDIMPPEKFCYNRKYQKAILGPLGWILSEIGLRSVVRVMFGVVPFHPDTPRTRQFLSKLNQTLLSMSRLSYLAESFVQVFSPAVAQFIDSSIQMNFVRSALHACSGIYGDSSSGPLCRSLLNFLPTDSGDEAADGAPGSWRDLLDAADFAMRRLYFLTACFRLNKLVGFGSPEEVENYTRFLLNEVEAESKTEAAANETSDAGHHPLLVASLLFDRQTPGFVKYRLRFPEESVEDTRGSRMADDTFAAGSRKKFPQHFSYFTSFFLHIQELLEHGIQAAVTGVEAPLTSYLTMFPSPCFLHDRFAGAIGSFLPMIMTVSWIYNVSLLVNAIVYEKETRLKEMMKIMGLSDGVHWVSWFITSFIIMTIASVLMTVLLKTGQLVVYSDPLLLFLFILSFVVSTIFEAFFISIFFSNSSVAAAFAGVIYFMGYLPFSLVETFANSMTKSHYLLACLIPQLAFGVGCRFISRWELASVGLQTRNFLESPLSSAEFPFYLVIIMLWVDSAIFMLLTWYLEKVFPGAFGVPKPWYFPFTASFWCGKRRRKMSIKNGITRGSGGSHPASPAPSVTSTPEPVSLLSEDHHPKPEHLEEEPNHLTVGVSIRNLTKVYRPGLCACLRNSKSVTAVDGLSYNFYEGQVTAFLGHNGAGKSTTMSILTGLYTPTSGTAYIAGYDIRTEMDEIRKHLGLCPQHNVLFDTLTVEDHIYFYGMLKGLTKAEVAPQIDSFVADVGLQQKKSELCKNLSGGMKRKLSVALAFVGASKIVLLDEPTAGVDPHARRAIWDVLAKFRQGRTIILTTHHMDEADILGDRICIINKGRLVCSGSPMFLKKVFGEGYTLTLVKASPECDLDEVLTLVQSEVPEASLGECTSSEINIKLPYNSVPRLAGLFAKLDSRLSQLKLATYGIEDSSLEGIFLSVTQYDLKEEEDRLSTLSFLESPSPLTRSVSLDRQSKGTQISRQSKSEIHLDTTRKSQHWRKQKPLCQQVKALWLKRFHVLRRSKIGFLAEFVLPVFFLLIALALLKIVPREIESPPMELAPWYMIGKPSRSRLKDLSVFQSRSMNAYPQNSTLMAMANKLMLHMNSTSFLGTRCMQPDVYSNPDFPCKTQYRGSVWSQAPSNLPTNTSWCRCSYENYPNSAKCVDWPKPARKTLMSGDVLESMQGYNLTNYIQSTVMEYYKLRFGGFTFFVNDTQRDLPAKASAFLRTRQFLGTLTGLINDNGTDKFLTQLASLIEDLSNPKNRTSLANEVWFDNRGYLSGPAYLNTLTNALMRALANDSLGAPEKIGVSAWSHPITSKTSYVENVLNVNLMVSLVTIISIIFALSFIPASFVLFLISERTSGSKQLQFVSGIHPMLYWLVNHLWNLINYLVPLTMVILLFVAFRNYEFIDAEAIGPFLVTMVLFGFASAPLMYPFSWVMSVPSKAFTMLSCLNLGIGFSTTMSVTIVHLIGYESNDKSLLMIEDVLKTVFLVLPHFCLGQALMELTIFHQLSAKLGPLLKEAGIRAMPVKRFAGFELHASSWDAAGRYLTCLAAQSLVYFGLVLLLEYNCCCQQGLVSSRFYRLFYRAEYERSLRQPDSAELDDDVRAEAEKVEGSGGDHLLELRRLVKIYSTSSGPRAAVKGISLGVKSHECFGFLGVNGAGKTTTFKMLTGDITPTSGDALISGFSILTEVREVYKQLGYCPQFDALLPLLTGRETLQLYARIRGVEEAEVGQLVEIIAKRVGIEPHLDKITHEYSGGNKRKLSCGIAFIGNPPIVFLDEPTAGMDPGARRFLWRCIQRMVSSGSCVILTTHSMEDCQALCHRLTIMVNGRLQCIGSPQHLKNKFGQGFTIFLRVRQPEASAATSADALAAVRAETQLERAHDAFMAAFPEAVLCENHASVLQYQLKQSVQLRDIFESVQKLKDSGLVLDYSVNQTTLDQVFINFAKVQSEAAD